MLTNKSFFELEAFDHKKLFPADSYVWDALKSLKKYMEDFAYPALPDELTSGIPLHKTFVVHNGNFFDHQDLRIELGDATKGDLKIYQGEKKLEGASVLMAGAVIIGNHIALGKGVKVEPGAFIQAPAIIGDKTEIRQGAYLRGYCLVGKRCVVGHVTEMKNSIFLDDAKAGHFAYVGDSILGNNVNLGAGTKLANLRFMRGDVQIRTADGPVSTGLRKLGAVLGDNAQTGCNAVTNPGTLLGKKSIVLPNTTAASGYHQESSIIR
jgi:NDP-sugar pyrophosphorylase family protein